MTIQWLEPWFAVASEMHRTALESELGRELGRAHVLFGSKAAAIAHRQDRDDVLFELEGTGVAEVHLTWRGSVELDARWPRTKRYPSLAAWIEDRMMPDREEWAALEAPSKLPPPADGWFLQSYSVDSNGRLARMCASVDIQAQLAHWSGSHTSRPDGLRELIAADTKTRIEVFSGSELVDAVVFPFETLAPKFDRLPDGRWVVADARCWDGRANARILAPEGSLLMRISLGDAIAHLQCDAVGGIWVGYFDEASGEEPPGAYGVNRFRPDGTIWWSPNPVLHPMILDCDAMSVGPDSVWLCYYTDFPIVQVTFDGALRQWRNDAIRGPSVIAADGTLAVLLGDYESEAGTGALLRLGDDGSARLLHHFALEPAMLAAIDNGFVFARGHEIHFIEDGTWSRITVEDIAAGLASNPPRFRAYVPPPESEPKPPKPSGASEQGPYFRVRPS